MPTRLILIAVAAGVILLLNSVYTVRETDQAMVLRFGKIERLVTTPGLHIKIPFVQQLMFFDKRVLETDSAAEELQAGDKKRAVVDSFTRWRIVDAEQFFKRLRTMQSAISQINNIVNSNIRQVVARESLMELVSGDRQRLMEEIQAAASTEAQPLGIEIVDVRIKRADLPEANSRAVFSRMREERLKEAKEIRATGAESAQKITADAEKQRTIIIAEAERDAQKLRGEGLAEAIKITGRAFNRDRSFYSFLRSLEAYRSSLNTGTTMVLDPSVEFMDVFEGK